MTEGTATLIGGLIDAALPDADTEGEYASPRNPRRPRGGEGMLGGGAPFYGIYTCADGLPLSVGCIEPQFWAALCRVTGLEELLPDQLDEARWPAMRQAFEQVFRGRTRDEWLSAFAGADTCVTPVLTPAEAREDAQIASRRVDGIIGGGRVQSAAPGGTRADPRSVLLERGYDPDFVRRLAPAGRRRTGAQAAPPDLRQAVR
jgi:crotonobetainyl-CoA:carnitine CoA-transferase CaiB-like acyl-CoA transferase